MHVQGRELSELRTWTSAKLAEMVRAGLSELGFTRSDFTISLEKLDPPSAQGNELVEFLFSANPGEPPRPLRSIGSSGEISRVMLALKSALADQDDVPVLVFDEIDANVGGEIAAKVATKMQTLGRSRQVFCITHLPQVAAAASRQFVVTKEVVDERTRTLAARGERQVPRARNRQNAGGQVEVRCRTRARAAEWCRLIRTAGC